MRNEVQPPQQLNQSIEYVGNLMRQLKGVPNAQSILMQALQNNPNMQPLISIIQNNGNLETIAKGMAAQQNININDVINKLSKYL